MCPGLKGFLLFCNNKERETIREAYNILNEYADQMYGQEDVLPKVSSTTHKNDPWATKSYFYLQKTDLWILCP